MGAKIVHVALNTMLNIFVKLIFKDGGRSFYCGLLEVVKGALGLCLKVVCDALLLDESLCLDMYLMIWIGEDDVDVGYEVLVFKIGEEQFFYLMARGIFEDEVGKLIVNGFIELIVKEFLMEYVVEMNCFIEF